MAAKKTKYGNGLETRVAFAVFAAAKTKTGARSQAKDLPGTPDFVFDDAKVAVMVHGCFWHGCAKHWKLPLGKPAFWRRKMLRNRRRDVMAHDRLEDLGWRVVTVWECDDVDLAAARILSAVEGRTSSYRNDD